LLRQSVFLAIAGTWVGNGMPCIFFVDPANDVSVFPGSVLA